VGGFFWAWCGANEAASFISVDLLAVRHYSIENLGPTREFYLWRELIQHMRSLRQTFVTSQFVMNCYGSCYVSALCGSVSFTAAMIDALVPEVSFAMGLHRIELGVFSIARNQ